MFPHRYGGWQNSCQMSSEKLLRHDWIWLKNSRSLFGIGRFCRHAESCSAIIMITSLFISTDYPVLTGPATIVTAKESDRRTNSDIRSAHVATCHYRLLAGAGIKSFIEPYPLTLNNDPTRRGRRRCRLINRPCSRWQLETFDRLEANDILFVDSSHVLKFNSDRGLYSFRHHAPAAPRRAGPFSRHLRQLRLPPAMAAPGPGLRTKVRASRSWPTIGAFAS